MPAPIQVFVRTRPTDKFANDEIKIDEDTIHVKLKPGDHGDREKSWSFKLNNVLHSASQSMVYESVGREIVDSCVAGFNGTIMSYGQTGAGKTYTMNGPSMNYETRGLTQRAVNQIFQSIEGKPECAYTIRVSYLEIYNDRLFDLLEPSNDGHMAVVNDAKGNVHIKGLSIHTAPSEEVALNLLFLGNTNRVVGPHALNRSSSRSHCVFTVYIESRMRVDCGSASVHNSRLNLLDLAGSERLKKTGSGGVTLKEAGYINKSLSFLEQVVLALSVKQNHVPYRSCRLTHVLHDSLGGNCKTKLIANIACDRANLDETISTLKFATRMMRISTEPTVNVQLDPLLLIKKYEREIKALKQELAMHDALSGRSAQHYDDYTEEMVHELQSMVQNYIDGESELEVSNLKQVYETYKIFRKLCLHYKHEAETGTGQKKERTKTPEEAGSSEKLQTKEESGGVGDIDHGSGFTVGSFPADGRPDGDQSGVLPKSPDKPVDDELRFDSENKALEYFKSSVEEGRVLSEEYENLRKQTKEKKQHYKEISQNVNNFKYQIDSLKQQLEERQNNEPDREDGVVDEQEFKLILEMKEIKKQYMDEFGKRGMIESELVYLRNITKAAQKKLLSTFLEWGQTKHIGAAIVEEPLDAAEVYTKAIEARAADPGESAYQKAKKTFLYHQRKQQVTKRMK